MKKILALLLALTLVFGLFGCEVPAPTTPSDSTSTPVTSFPATDPSTAPSTAPTDVPEPPIAEDGHFNSKEEVALYIHTYGRLPENYVTKSFCQKELKCSTNRVQDFWPDGAIGGDVFHNREGRLPAAPGRTWTECDINTWGKYARGAERIVFSNDGLVYYTADHYYTFELLYGEP